MKLRSNIDLGASFEKLKYHFDRINNDLLTDATGYAHSTYAGKLNALITHHLNECTESEDDLKDLDVFSSPGNSKLEQEIIDEMDKKEDVFGRMGEMLKPDEWAEYGNSVLPRKDYPRNTNKDL